MAERGSCIWWVRVKELLSSTGGWLGVDMGTGTWIIPRCHEGMGVVGGSIARDISRNLLVWMCLCLRVPKWRVVEGMGGGLVEMLVIAVKGGSPEYEAISGRCGGINYKRMGLVHELGSDVLLSLRHAFSQGLGGQESKSTKV